jgi:predicted transcriptional regulator
MTNPVDQKSVEKWGEAAHAGFQLLPDLLLKKQRELGLSATDVLVLINMTMHWWYVQQRPFPRTSTIADRMGVDPRTVQRSIDKLVKLKLVEKVREKTADGSKHGVYDLRGLVERLSQYAVRDRDMVRPRKAAEAHQLL